MGIPNNQAIVIGMDGDKLGDEIALAINRALVSSTLLPTGYLYGNRWSSIVFRAIGRAIVAHIQNNMVVTVLVKDYYTGSEPDNLIPPGTIDAHFTSEDIK